MIRGQPVYFIVQEKSGRLKTPHPKDEDSRRKRKEVDPRTLTECALMRRTNL